MGALQEAIRETRDRAAEDIGSSVTSNATMNGRQYTITATTIRSWIFSKKTNIKVECKNLEGRECSVEFTYNNGRDIDKNLNDAKANKIEIDAIFDSKFLEFSGRVSSCTQSTHDNVNSYAGSIHVLLNDMEDFVRRNDLSKEQMLSLKGELRKLCGKPFIGFGMGIFSINEFNIDPRCRDMAIRAESLEILLDAKACGQVGLERNIPPKVKNLGKGAFSVVQLAHMRPPGENSRRATGPIALKPCDQSRSEKNPDKFTHGADQCRIIIGRVSGSYGRNRATSGVQDMLCDIGKRKGIIVPHVIASVSAAEINGVPCIAMEAIKGETVGVATRNDQISSNDNEFRRRETWIQIQDVLTGQIDRHRSNVMLTRDDRPVAIDHDLSFPTNPPRDFANTVPITLVVPCTMQGGKSGYCAIDGKSYRNYCMPPVIDEDMYNVIMAIDLTKLEDMCKECGLTRPEIAAAMNRARGLQNAAVALKESGMVIKPSKWSHQYLGVTNSYAARHYHRRRK
jgi:hypothetical protein